jgi:hypothetical protein
VPDMHLHNQNIEGRIEGRYYTVQSNVQYNLYHIEGLVNTVDCNMLVDNLYTHYRKGDSNYTVDCNTPVRIQYKMGHVRGLQYTVVLTTQRHSLDMRNQIMDLQCIVVETKHSHSQDR